MMEYVQFIYQHWLITSLFSILWFGGLVLVLEAMNKGKE